jgi:SAM-dependent methyltransferase
VANGLSDGSLPNVAPRQAISLNRFEKALFRLNRDMNIIEIGPSYGPMAPRSGGWKTKIIDHIDRDGLIEKYKDRQDVGNIEPVDFIWRNGPLESAVPAELHGTFDACIASHVIEHAPDLVAFLSSIERLLTKGGFLSLAIPDKRYMFDCFQSLSTTADALDAHHLKRTRHSRRAAFQNTAYQVFRNDNEATWYPGATGELRIGQDVKWAKRNFDLQDEDDSAPYVDWHAWFFTPSSFELIMLELRELGLIDYQVDVLFPPSDCEFHVTLIKGAGAPAERDIQEIRLRLMEQIVVELGAQARDYSISSPGEAGL